MDHVDFQEFSRTWQPGKSVGLSRTF